MTQRTKKSLEVGKYIVSQGYYNPMEVCTHFKFTTKTLYSRLAVLKVADKNLYAKVDILREKNKAEVLAENTKRIKAQNAEAHGEARAKALGIIEHMLEHKLTIEEAAGDFGWSKQRLHNHISDIEKERGQDDELVKRIGKLKEHNLTISRVEKNKEFQRKAKELLEAEREAERKARMGNKGE